MPPIKHRELERVRTGDHQQQAMHTIHFEHELRWREMA